MTAAPVAVGLVARTRVTEPPDDLLAALAPDGFAWLTDAGRFVASGVAARIPAEQAEDVLAAVGVDDDVDLPGTGAIAVGALPFHDAMRGELVLPARVVGVSAEGRGWVTEIGPVGTTPPRAPAPSRYVVETRMSRSEWCRAVAALLHEITAGRLEKAVLAREVLVTADVPLDARTVLERLARTQGPAYVFAAAGLVGASPELLVHRRGTDVVSRPMAGTVRRETSAEADAAAGAGLVSSPKQTAEHRLVVDAVVAGLRSTGIEVDPVGAPELARAGRREPPRHRGRRAPRRGAPPVGAHDRRPAAPHARGGRHAPRRGPRRDRRARAVRPRPLRGPGRVGRRRR